MWLIERGKWVRRDGLFSTLRVVILQGEDIPGLVANLAAAQVFNSLVV